MGWFQPRRVVVGLWFGVAIVSVACSSFLQGNGIQAQPDTGGYPYAGLACVRPPYNVTGACANYDWGTKQGSVAASSIYSPYGYSYRNCTDYVAWRLRSAGVPDGYVRGLGNAKDWAARARVKGIVVDTTPSVGSVAVRTGGLLGHVGYVVAVDGNRITVADYNRLGTGVYGITTGSPASLKFDTFVHFESLMAAPAPSPQVLAAAASKQPEVPVTPIKRQSRADLTLVATGQGTPTGSGMVEAHTLDAEKEFKAWAARQGTAAPYSSPATRYLTGDVNGDSRNDLVLFDPGPTASGRSEVRVLDGQTHFATWLDQKVSAAGYVRSVDEVLMGDANGDKKADIVIVASGGTASGMVEVRVLDGATGFTTELGNWVTASPSGDPFQYMLGDVNGDDRADLVLRTIGARASGRTEIHVLDGARQFSSWLGRWATAAGTDDEYAKYLVGDVTGDNLADLVVVMAQATGSGKTEVHAIDGARAYADWAGHWATPSAYADDSVRFVMSGD